MARKTVHTGRVMRSGTLALLFSAWLLAGCEKEADIGAAFPQVLPPDAACAVDGMLLMDHPGPKGQALLKDGTVQYFCDTKELFSALHDPDQSHRIVRAFVQPMAGDAFEARADGFEDAGSLWYVLDAAMEGAMGKTIIPFRTEDAAKAFVAREGGWILPARELSAQIVADYVRAVRESLRAARPAGAGPPAAKHDSH
jgi:copper chaperone NosL